MGEPTALTLDTIHPSCAAILDCSYNGIVIMNRNGVIILYNEAAKRLLRIQQDSPVGMHMSEIMPMTWPDLKHVVEDRRAADRPPDFAPPGDDHSQSQPDRRGTAKC